ncbi:hypothetical protein LCGC14_2281770, partial [marine sediment metagenome]
LDVSNVAFAENTALTEEAAKRYQTTESQMKIFKNTLRDVGITIGSFLLPFLNKMLQFVKPLIDEFGKRFPEFINNFLIPTFQKIVDFLKTTLPGAFSNMQSFIKPIIDGIKNLFGAFSESAPVALASMQEFLSWFQTNMVPIIQSIGQRIGDILDEIAEFWRQNGEQIIERVTIAFKFITTTITGALDFLLTFINAWLKILNGDWTGAWQAIKDVLIRFIESALSIVGVDLDSFVKSWTGIWTNIKIIVTTIWDTIVKAIRSKIKGVVNFVKKQFEKLKAALKKILGIGSPSKVFKGFGEDMMAGLAEGVLSSFRLPEAAVTLAATKVIQPMGQVAAPPVSGASTTRNNSVNNVFNNNLQDRMDVELLANRVEQIFVRALG